MARKLTTEEFIQKAISVHGDKYDYSKTMYVNARTKIIIVCYIHGAFEQLPQGHLKGQGCPICGGTGKHTINNFMLKAKEKHGTNYTYEKVEYINARIKVIITCKVHGDFEQSPNSHLSGNGCRKCATNLLTTTSKTFIEKAKLIHNKVYAYTKVKYINSKTKITITCPIHGDWEQTPGNHLSGAGCYICAKEKTLLSKNKFIENSMKIHGDRYDYSIAEYTKDKNKIQIICGVHGIFWQIANRHMAGRGCPSCATHGFDSTKPAYLYYLKITTDDEQVLYKIGITNRTVNERFNLTDLAKIEIVKQKLYAVGLEALEWETKLKRLYKQYQYKGPDVLSSGNTELFTEDIIAIL